MPFGPVGTIGRTIGHIEDYPATTDVRAGVTYRNGTRLGTFGTASSFTTDTMTLNAYVDGSETAAASGTVSLAVDMTAVRIHGRGRQVQIEVLNYNGACPVELVSLAVTADVTGHD